MLTPTAEGLLAEALDHFSGEIRSGTFAIHEPRLEQRSGNGGADEGAGHHEDCEEEHVVTGSSGRSS